MDKQLLQTINNGDFDRFEQLLTSGEYNLNDVDADDRTFLHHATLENQLDITELLLRNKVNVNKQDQSGWTALHYAAQGHYVELVKVLLLYNANPNIKDDYGNSALWRAVFASQGRGEIIELLLKNNADPHLKNNNGMSPLELAEQIGNYDTKRFFKQIDEQ